MKNVDGKSKGFGYVNFEKTEDALKAIKSFNGKEIDGRQWYVAKGQTTNEREEAEVEAREEGSENKADNGNKALNLYIKNLDFSIDENKLKELFKEHGTVTSCKVMRAENGIRLGAGFVAFSTSEEASRALAEMNGKIVFWKPLYVAIAETKEERKAKFKVSVPQRQTWQLPRKFKRPDSPTVKDLEALLENKTAEVRRKVLGESLYPLVETHEPILARKITGMILEMKETEILHLIASPDDLKSKIV